MHNLIFIFCILITLTPTSFAQDISDADILIIGGTVVDGSGGEPYRADLMISNGSIVRIGIIDTSRVKSGRVIDAAGMIVSPGFIDAHAHGDPLETPDFKNFLAMGVTSIVLGQDGASPHAEDLSGWFAKVDALHPGVNIALFAGHGTLRTLAGKGTETGPLPMNATELNTMTKLIENAMVSGCFGFSTGLEYEPGRFASLDELVTAASSVHRHGGMVMSHMRSEDEDTIAEALDELLEQGIRSGAPVHVSHIKIVYGNDVNQAKRLLAQMEEVRTSGVRVTADIYPYIASYTGIGIVFPEWARPPHIYSDVVAARRGELAAYLRERITLRNGPEATLFGTHPYAGKTLAQVAEELDKPFEDVLIDDIGPGGMSAAYFVMNEDVLRTFLTDPHVMISSDGSPAMRHPRGYGTFAKIIRQYVSEENVLTLEEAVYKMTGLTARTLGLDALSRPRGLIKDGFAADVLIFDPDEVEDRATFEEPHLHAKGFEYVIVNGSVAKEGEIFSGERTGRVLYRNR